MEYRVTNVNENALNLPTRHKPEAALLPLLLAHCKNKVVILTKCLPTTVSWQPLLCNFMNGKDSCSGSWYLRKALLPSHKMFYKHYIP